jgi:hypothetical protein
MEISMELPQKTKNRTAICSAKVLLGIYLKKCESAYNRIAEYPHL